MGVTEQPPEAAVSVRDRRTIEGFRRILLHQAALILCVSAACLLLGVTQAYSALLGGLLYLLPNLYFAWRALRRQGTDSAQRIVIRMYASEIGKMTLAVALFSATFQLVQPLSPFPLFGTFILLQLSGGILQLKQCKHGF
ncbi:MAG: ATP synthase subunit I [Pseudomonadota bacterium]|jgi:ATP synthase protein I|nr:ATP synthase subunit I [Pseudomonadota bacterium]